MKLVLLFVLAASVSYQAEAHAYVYWPTSREALTKRNPYNNLELAPYAYSSDYVSGYLGDRFRGKLDTKHGKGQGGATGSKKLDDWSKNGDGCNGLPMGSPAATYTEGQEMEVVIPFHSQKGGEFEFRLCTKKWDTMSSDKERLQCLDEHLLYRDCVEGCGCKGDKCKWNAAHKDPKDPLYTKYKGIGLHPGATTQGGQLVKVKIPKGTACEHCTVQWYWFTAWSQEYWGCFDIKIEKAGTMLPPTTTLLPSATTMPQPPPLKCLDVVGACGDKSAQDGCEVCVGVEEGEVKTATGKCKVPLSSDDDSSGSVMWCTIGQQTPCVDKDAGAACTLHGRQGKCEDKYLLDGSTIKTRQFCNIWPIQLPTQPPTTTEPPTTVTTTRRPVGLRRRREAPVSRRRRRAVPTRPPATGLRRRREAPVGLRRRRGAPVVPTRPPVGLRRRREAPVGLRRRRGAPVAQPGCRQCSAIDAKLTAMMKYMHKLSKRINDLEGA